MCLLLNDDSKEIVANKDIICYKILKKKSENYAISPYYRFQYIVGAIYKLNKKLKVLGFVNKIVEEGFHSFEQFDSAKDYLNDRQMFYLGWRIYKCVIPKGAIMLYGRFGEFSSIVSDTIKIIEEVPLNDK